MKLRIDCFGNQSFLSVQFVNYNIVEMTWFNFAGVKDRNDSFCDTFIDGNIIEGRNGFSAFSICCINAVCQDKAPVIKG